MAPKPHATKPTAPGSHVLALAQARAFRMQAETAHATLGPAADPSPPNVGAMLAATVSVAFAVELYFKAFMAVARGGQVTPRHELTKLYAEFPPVLRAALEARYVELCPADGWRIPVVALRRAPEQPAVPDGYPPGPGYETFAAAVQELDTEFVRLRYFHETLSLDGWSMFTYAAGPGLALAATLDTVVERYLAGGFKHLMP